jgi:hypothetical protein
MGDFMKNKAKLNHAISKAASALDEIDNFDLDSAVPELVEEFERLKKEHEKALVEVITLAKQQ